jgi:hypothetical protein
MSEVRHSGNLRAGQRIATAYLFREQFSDMCMTTDAPRDMRSLEKIVMCAVVRA